MTDDRIVASYGESLIGECDGLVDRPLAGHDVKELRPALDHPCRVAVAELRGDERVKLAPVGADHGSPQLLNRLRDSGFIGRLGQRSWDYRNDGGEGGGPGEVATVYWHVCSPLNKSR